MRAKDVKCPKCQGAISPNSADPEYDLDPPDQLIPSSRVTFDAHCVNGHHFMVDLARAKEDEPLEVVRAGCV